MCRVYCKHKLSILVLAKWGRQTIRCQESARRKDQQEQRELLKQRHGLELGQGYKHKTQESSHCNFKETKMRQLEEITLLKAIFIYKESEAQTGHILWSMASGI